MIYRTSVHNLVEQFTVNRCLRRYRAQSTQTGVYTNEEVIGQIVVGGMGIEPGAGVGADGS